MKQKYSALDDEYIMKMAKQVSRYDGNELIFSQITSNHEWEQLGLFRLKHYAHKNTYMLTELNKHGFDKYDLDSKVYAARFNGNIIATIRLLEYPFETNYFINDDALSQFLGPQYRKEYVEWTRLLIQPNSPVKFILPALLIYAGMKTLTSYLPHKYFGYSTLTVKRLFSRFQLSNEKLTFTIPRRGEQAYTLLKGDFISDFETLQV